MKHYRVRLQLLLILLTVCALAVASDEPVVVDHAETNHAETTCDQASPSA